MLTLNIDLSDSLVNIQILYCWYSTADNRSTVDNTEFTEFGISKIYLKFDDPLVGKQLMQCLLFHYTPSCSN